MEQIPNNESKGQEIFEAEDLVVWRKEMQNVEDLVKKYGEGPFKVVSVRSQSIGGQVVVLEMKDGSKMPFASAWLKRS